MMLVLTLRAVVVEAAATRCGAVSRVRQLLEQEARLAAHHAHHDTGVAVLWLHPFWVGGAVVIGAHSDVGGSVASTAG
jgi:hypothetical protein